MNVLLWIIQILLAALFLFAGVLKLVLPLDKLTGPVAVPGLFLRFIGLCETLGGLGLILPGLLRIRMGLTPLAAAGLVIIMVGATVLNLHVGESTTLTIVVGLLAAFVAYARWKAAPRQKSGLLRVFVWAFINGLVLLILLAIVVDLYANVAAGATLVKAQADVQTLASAVDQYQAHMGAPPATLAELTSPATNARGQTDGPYRASIPPTARGFSDYRYERHADGHWTITTSGRDSC